MTTSNSKHIHFQLTPEQQKKIQELQKLKDPKLIEDFLRKVLEGKKGLV